MKKLLLSLFAVGVLLTSKQAQAQLHHGRPEVFKQCNGIVVETADDKAQVVARYTQSLEAGGYKVLPPTEGSNVLVARRLNVGPTNAQVTLLFMIQAQPGKTTQIFTHGFYQDASMKLPAAIANWKPEVMATTWAAEQQAITAYADPKATYWYRREDLSSFNKEAIMVDKMNKSDKMKM